MKTTAIIIFSVLILGCSLMFSQVAVNTDGSAPDNSAMLDVQAIDRGLLIPRISTFDRDLIPSPGTGLIIYNSTTNQINYYNGSSWYYIETLLISSTVGSLSLAGGVSVNVSPGTFPEHSSILDINNSSRGVLIPGTTPESITDPATGLIIYNTTTNLLNYYNGVQWFSLCAFSTGVPGAGGSQASVGMAIRADNSNSHQSAILDISAISKGVLIPRLTSQQRDAILPAPGLIIYNTTVNKIEFYNGSAWYQLRITFLSSPIAGTHISSPTQIAWNWNAVDGATGYKWSSTNNYATATDMGTETTWTETGLLCGTEYTRYVWAYNICGNSTGTVLNQQTSVCLELPSVTTSEAMNITEVSAVSGGNVTSDGGDPVTARGVCWSTSSNPTVSGSHTTDGSGTGTFVSSLTGLTEETQYYARAYATNTIGTAYGNEISFTTGDSVTVVHITGPVAPEDKTVNYGTVRNPPGSPSKTWATSNLGASHQATAKNDTTESSAGWYWQFNRAQGYKHDGTTRTPNTTWITGIYEYNNWNAENDPCSIEMGGGWRVPTYTEWSNVDNWSNWNGAWNSILKLHAAGYLKSNDGSLDKRGVQGLYWSSMHQLANTGFFLWITNFWCYMYANDKAFGNTIRCIRD